jgi:hypothetical protein
MQEATQMADEKSTIAAVAMDKSDFEAKAIAEGYDPSHLIYSARRFINLFRAISAVMGQGVAMSGVTTMLATLGPVVLPLETMQQVLRDTADSLPEAYAHAEERDRGDLETRKDLN